MIPTPTLPSLVGFSTTNFNSGVGADIVMESITLMDHHSAPGGVLSVRDVSPHRRLVALLHHYVADGDSEIAFRRERSSRTRATPIKENPIIAPQGQGPFGPTARSLFGIQPVRPTTRRGKTKILTIVTLDRMNQESRNPIDGTCPMPLIVKGTQDGRKVTGVHVSHAHLVMARYRSEREQCAQNSTDVITRCDRIIRERSFWSRLSSLA